MKNRHFAAEIRFFSALRISIEVNSILLSERNVRLRTSIILHFGVFSPSLALCISFSPTLLHSLSLSFSRKAALLYSLFICFIRNNETTAPRASRKSSALLVYLCFVQRKESMRKNLPAFSLYRYTSDYMSRDKCLRYTNALPDHRYYTSTVNNGDRYSDND